MLLPRRRRTLDELSKLGPVDIPDIPSQPTELEHCAAALFQAARYFVELNVIERDPEDVLELDVVATSYDGDAPSRVLAEAKSGKWGYSDIFKLCGWMRYLAIPQGAMFACKAPRSEGLDQLKERVAHLDISVIKLDSPALGTAFAEAGFPEIVDAEAVEVWRYVYAVQDAMISYARQLVKQKPALKGPTAVLRYQQVIDNEVFFEPDPRVCLNRLYDAFKEHPRLALGVAREIEGKGFDCDVEDDPNNQTVAAAMFQGDFDLIQACFYLEHKARLAILKTAIDICLFEVQPKPMLKISGKVVLTQDDFLPPTFRDGLAKLKEHPYFKRYAVFWQVFLWGFGGFYLKDRKDEEFALLSEQTGVPVDEIPNALQAFDLLFPTNGSWVVETNTACVLVKMMPMALRGIGSYHRQLRMGFKSFAELRYGDYTAVDLQRWYHKAYETLKLREVDS